MAPWTLPAFGKFEPDIEAIANSSESLVSMAAAGMILPSRAHFHRDPLGCASFGRLLCRSSVKDHSGYAPSSLRASSQNTQQRRYTSHGFAALDARIENWGFFTDVR